MELVEIIAELENYTGKLPRQAIEEAVENREAITPLLLETLEKWIGRQEELLELPDYFLHIYALLLLAQFREPKAYPLIIKFFSTPDEKVIDFAGDIVTEHLGRILATVSEGNIEPLQQLIENLQVNEFVRGAALDSLLVLVNQEVISRNLVIDYFEELFQTELEKQQNSEAEHNYFLTDLVICSSKLYPLKLKSYIDQAFESGMIDLLFFEHEDVEYYLDLGLDATLEELRHSKHYGFIEDTASEIESWYSFPEQGFKSTRNRPPELVNLSPQKKSNKSKKKSKKKMQKKSRRQNRSKKK
ncbi:MAG: DUF1186 domain-containing protein [Cyanobacteria bacterium J06621_8]